MVGSIERIAQEIAVLEQAVTELAAEFHSSYATYLTGLGQSVRQQLILASYYVCTQGYPTSFLELPFGQRQQLQQMLKALAQQVQEELLAQLHMPVVVEDPEVEELLALAPALSSESVAEPAAKRSTRPLLPLDLARWQQDLEQAIVQELRTASHAANRLLQQAGVMPHKVPEPILEAATQAEMAEFGGGDTPNLLNVLIEANGETGDNQEKSEEAPDHTVMHIVAIHLRLAEIEFADPPLTAARTQIRALSGRLKVLGRDYRKKQRDRAIAEAQAAWRTSWTDD
jgi:hypothetical protein